MHSLTLKLTLAFLIVSLAGIALVALLIGGFTTQEFNRLLTDRRLNEYTSTATAYYKQHGSWEGIASAYERGILYAPESRDLVDQRDPVPPPFFLVDLQGKLLIDMGPFRAGEQAPVERNQDRVEITANNKVVGYILVTGGQARPNPLEERFLSRMTQAVLLATLGATVLAVLLGLFLARTITRPVRDLTLATSAMAKGNLSQQVPVRSRDELGELTRTFNQMSADLERANALRRQMTADIAHDLRTPLAVITGYLEGLKDGVLKPSPKRFAAMYDESVFLQRLVEDLRTLSLADAGELSMNYQPTQPAELIERCSTSFQHQAELAGVRLATEVAPDLPPIRTDPERMLQALGNLVSNAMRYTPGGGEIRLSARQKDGMVLLEVEDNGKGIAPDALPHVFDRFYRGDEARHEGGSGLGLAIARSLVELQGGTITAESEGVGKGSRFVIWVEHESTSLYG